MLARLWCCRPICKWYSKLRKKLDFLPHFPTILLSFVFWWFYQVYVCGYLAFVENDALVQLIYGLIVCSGIGMTAASVYGTTLQRYPLIPSKFFIGSDFDELSREKQCDRVEEIIRNTGANSMHVTRICTTCRIVRTERSHHCAICNRCTPRLDHHCVALHKCIHYKNQKQFTLFFFWMCLSLTVAIISFHPYVMRAHREAAGHSEMQKLGFPTYMISLYTWHYSRYLGKTYTFSSLSIICLVLSSILTYCLLVIFSFVLFNFMWFCNIQNGSILACNKSTKFSKRFPCIFFKESHTRCFRKDTILENLQVIFGKDWKLWLIPVAISDTDGWLHRCKCTQSDSSIC